MRIFSRAFSIAAPDSNWSRVYFLLLLGGLLSAADESPLRTALDEHRWFDLRDAVMSGPAPPLYRFFVAAVFNDQRSALESMSAVTHSGAKADQLAPLHYALYRLYYRLGRYRESAAEERRTWELGPAQSLAAVSPRSPSRPAGQSCSRSDNAAGLG